MPKGEKKGGYRLGDRSGKRNQRRRRGHHLLPMFGEGMIFFLTKKALIPGKREPGPAYCRKKRNTESPLGKLPLQCAHGKSGRGLYGGERISAAKKKNVSALALCPFRKEGGHLLQGGEEKVPLNSEGGFWHFRCSKKRERKGPA